MARLPIALAALALSLGAGSAPAAAAPSRCASSKLAAVAANAACLLGLEGKEAKSGTPPDAAKLQRCRDKLAKAFEKAEAKPPCLTSGDSASIQALVDALVTDLDGALSVGVQAACRVERLFTVRAGAFRPPPRVQSAVVRLTPRPEPLVAAAEQRAFRTFVTACFTRRRKQLRNALAGVWDRPPDVVVGALGRLGIDPTAPAEPRP